MDLQELITQFQELLQHFKDHIHGGNDTKKIRVRDLDETGVVAKAHLAGAQATTGGPDKVLLDTASFTASGITFASNKLTILTAGKYLVIAKIGIASLPDAQTMRVLIYKNGSLISTSKFTASVAGAVDMYSLNVGVFSLNANDYIELYVAHSNSPTSYSLIVGEGITEMSVTKII